MGPWESTPSSSTHEHSVRCTGRNRSWIHGRTPLPRVPTSILCAAQVVIAHGSMGEHPIHEHPRASCALHRSESLMGPWESTPSTSTHKHPVRCTGRNRSWVHGRAGRNRSCVHGRAPHPRASTIVLCAAQVVIAHGSMGEHPSHENPRASCALQR